MNMNKPTQAEIHMLSVEAMLRNAEEMIESSRHDASISQNTWIGQKAAFLKVHRMLKNTVTEEQKLSLDESLALMKRVEDKPVTTYDLPNLTASVPFARLPGNFDQLSHAAQQQIKREL